MRTATVIRHTVPYAVPVVVLAAVIVLFLRMQSHRTLSDSDFARQHGAPLPVRVYQVDVGPLNQAIPAECTAQANPLVRIGTKIPQRVVARSHVRQGQHVKPGTPLISLDDQREQQALTRAQSLTSTSERLIEATKELVLFFRGLRDEGLGQERELRLAELDLARAQIDLARAEAELKAAISEMGNTRIAAGTAGVVVEVAQPGEVSLSTGELVRIAVIDPVLLECQLPEDKLLFVKPGQNVKVSFVSRPGESYEGPLKRIEASDKQDERLIGIAVEIPNPDALILPGLHGLAEVRNDYYSLRVPSTALINPRPDLAQVFKIDADNQAHLTEVSVGASAGGYVQISAGLVAGDRVVVAGQLGLLEGDKVRIGTDEDLREGP